MPVARKALRKHIARRYTTVRSIAVLCAGALASFVAPHVTADEGGMSFWLPGQMGSLSAVPGTPGWSLGLVYYHTTADADASRTFPLGGRLTAGVDARADLLFIAPNYVFTAPVAGGKAAVGLTAVTGRTKVRVNATLTGPLGNELTGSESDALEGVGDLYPMASLKWNRGDHNFMVYTMAGVPVGSYSAGRLANLGTNHWSLDGGGGYTYVDAKKGHEFTAVLGLTYNWENHDTDYKNGTSAHLDWAASQFFSEQLHAGLAGYFYRQVSGDSGAGAVLGDFKSRVSAIGPQIGYLFPVGGQHWYVNLKGFYEYDAENRPRGWNTWLTLSIPLRSDKN